MFKRPGLLATVLVGSVGIPYLATSSAKIKQGLSGMWPAAEQAKLDGPSAANPAATGMQAVKAPGTATGTRATAGRNAYHSVDLAEVLRFDVSTGWILSRWDRVSAGLADLDLQGYRVPLVTGTGYDDVAGSLTYYFDKQQKVQRITFRGTTGNPRKLVALVTNRYGLMRQATDDPAVFIYQANWNGKPESELRIKPARVVRADLPYARYQLELALRRH